MDDGSSNSSTTTKKTKYVTFNKAFSLFIKDMISKFPSAMEFKLIRAGYKVVKALSVKLVHKLFINSVDPYVSYIRSKDDSFFMDKNFSAPEDFSLVYREMVPVFVGLWKALDLRGREDVWLHLHRLLDLSAVCRNGDLLLSSSTHQQQQTNSSSTNQSNQTTSDDNSNTTMTGHNRGQNHDLSRQQAIFDDEHPLFKGVQPRQNRHIINV
jgi:hypothetical protein